MPSIVFVGLVVEAIGDAAMHTLDYTNMILSDDAYGPNHTARYVANARGTCIMFETNPGTWIAPPTITNRGDCGQNWLIFNEAEQSKMLAIFRKIPKHCLRT